MPFKIFLSSTYSDLIEERQAFGQVVVALGQHFRGIEHFFAREETPLETCISRAVADARPRRLSSLRNDRFKRRLVHGTRILARGRTQHPASCS